jgi:hypothetical protein
MPLQSTAKTFVFPPESFIIKKDILTVASAIDSKNISLPSRVFYHNNGEILINASAINRKNICLPSKVFYH